MIITDQPLKLSTSNNTKKTNNINTCLVNETERRYSRSKKIFLTH